MTFIDSRHSNGHKLCPSPSRHISVLIRSGIHTVFALNWKEKKIASQFNFTYRYINDVLSIDNPDFENYLGQMYPAELDIKDTTESNTSSSYLDLLLSIESDGQLRTSLYDKRDDFNFHITRKRKRSDSVLWQKPLHQHKCQKGKVTTQTTPQKSSIKQRLRTDFPFLNSNIPSAPTYGVLSHSSYGMPGLPPLMNVLFLGRREFHLSFSDRDTSWNVWNRPSGSFLVDKGIS